MNTFYKEIKPHHYVLCIDNKEIPQPSALNCCELVNGYYVMEEIYQLPYYKLIIRFIPLGTAFPGLTPASYIVKLDGSIIHCHIGEYDGSRCRYMGPITRLRNFIDAITSEEYGKGTLSCSFVVLRYQNNEVLAPCAPFAIKRWGKRVKGFWHYPEYCANYTEDREFLFCEYKKDINSFHILYAFDNSICIINRLSENPYIVFHDNLDFVEYVQYGKKCIGGRETVRIYRLRDICEKILKGELDNAYFTSYRRKGICYYICNWVFERYERLGIKIPKREINKIGAIFGFKRCGGLELEEEEKGIIELLSIMIQYESKYFSKMI